MRAIRRRFATNWIPWCARGDMENRIKDQQLCLFADRTSSTQWWTNQWRLTLSGFAYTLFERLRTYLRKTPFERMSASSLRLKLFKGVRSSSAIPGAYGC